MGITARARNPKPYTHPTTPACARFVLTESVDRSTTDPGIDDARDDGGGGRVTETAGRGARASWSRVARRGVVSRVEREGWRRARCDER